MTMAVVKSGLKYGEKVLLNPDHFRTILENEEYTELAQF
jgi:hypothetical protein